MAKFNEKNNINNNNNSNKSKKLSENKYGNKLNYYDLIFNDINEINPKEETVPYKEFFEDDYLGNIKSLLKPFGIYTVNIMSSNYKPLFDSYIKLEKNFPSIFTIPSEGGLCSIYFCFKDKIEIKDYLEKFKINKETIEKSSIIEHSVVNYL